MKSKKILITLLLFIFALTFFSNTCLGGHMHEDDYLYTDSYKTTLQEGEADYIFGKSAVVINVLRRIAIIVSIVTISIIGIRYMLGSVDQKAEYKQTMMPVVIGCILIGGISVILTAIQSIF